MIARILTAFLIALSAALSGCAGAPQNDVTVNVEPNYDGIYRLGYSAAGGALYYRFYPGGVVLSTRTDAPAADIYDALTVENARASRGTWSSSEGELRVGVEEGTVTYDSRFDIRPGGRIALRGLPRSFEFIRSDAAAGSVAAR